VRTPDRTLILSAAGFAVAALVFAAALARALTIEPTPPAVTASAVASPPADEPAPSGDVAGGDDAELGGRVAGAGAADVGGDELAAPPALAGSPEVDAAEARALTLDALTLAVDNDPFQPDRRRPAEPYRMPGEDVGDPEAPPPPPPPPPFTLLGTAEMGAGGIAVMRVEESLPRVMTVGESLMGYRLDAVKGDAATLSGQGQTVTLTVAQASPNPDPEPDRRTRRRGDDDDDERGRGSPTERAQLLREQVLQRALEQQLRRQEGEANENVRRLIDPSGQPNREVRFENGRIIIRGDTNSTGNRRGGGGREEMR
jgi:hypothetical protein